MGIKFDFPKREDKLPILTEQSKLSVKLRFLSIPDLKGIMDESQAQMTKAETLDGDYEKWFDIFNTCENELHYRIEELFGLND